MKENKILLIAEACDNHLKVFRMHSNGKKKTSSELI